MLYPGCQLAMVHGITDLIDIAGQLSANHGGPVARVSHWSLQNGGGFARSHDSHPEDGTKASPSYLLIPGRLTGPMELAEALHYEMSSRSF